MNHIVITLYDFFLLKLVLLQELSPETFGLVHEFDIKRVVVANHDDVLILRVNKLDVGDGVLDKKLRLEGIVIVLDILCIVGLHAL